MTTDDFLWTLALVMKSRLNAKGGTICTNLSEICEGVIRSWLIADAGIRGEWLTHPGLLPEDLAEAVAVLERKRDGRGKGPKRQKKPKDSLANVPYGFRTSESDATWFFALEAWCEPRNLMLLDVKNGRPMVQLGPQGCPSRSSFL